MCRWCASVLAAVASRNSLQVQHLHELLAFGVNMFLSILQFDWTPEDIYCAVTHRVVQWYVTRPFRPLP